MIWDIVIIGAFAVVAAVCVIRERATQPPGQPSKSDEIEWSQAIK